jgi:hypothetical protein
MEDPLGLAGRTIIVEENCRFDDVVTDAEKVTVVSDIFAAVRREKKRRRWDWID